MFNPLFERHPTAAALVGWMITAYGELEYKLAECVGYAIGDKDDGLLVYFKIISESTRLNTAFTLLKRPMREMSLEDELGVVVGAMRFCVGARNRYAHSHWANDKRLWFLDMQAATTDTFVRYEWKHTNIPLLREQKAFFSHTSACISYLSEVTQYRLQGRTGCPSHVQWPAHTAVPKLCIPPKKPLPLWYQSALPDQPAAQPPKQTHTEKRQLKADRKAKWKPKK